MDAAKKSTCHIDPDEERNDMCIIEMLPTI